MPIDYFPAPSNSAKPPDQTPRSPELRHLLALVLGAGIPYAFLIYESLRTHRGKGSITAGLAANLPISSTSVILLMAMFYLLFWGGWVLFFLRGVCGEKLASLNQRPGSWYSDIRDGLLLCITHILLVGGANKLISVWLNYTQTSAQQDMAQTTAITPAMMLATLAFNWTAAASFEEFLRVFCMTRIQKFSSGAGFQVLAVTVSTVLFACYHLHYGLNGAVLISLGGFLYGGYYAYRGRLSPLIISHGFYGTYAWLANWSYYAT